MASAFLISQSKREVLGILAEGFIGLMPKTNDRIRPTKETAKLREIDCPSCKERVLFRKVRKPRFDCHGFEIYHFDCEKCGAFLVGIIDPQDGALLLSVP